MKTLFCMSLWKGYVTRVFFSKNNIFLQFKISYKQNQQKEKGGGGVWSLLEYRSNCLCINLQLTFFFFFFNPQKNESRESTKQTVSISIFLFSPTEHVGVSSFTMTQRRLGETVQVSHQHQAQVLNLKTS